MSFVTNGFSDKIIIGGKTATNIHSGEGLCLQILNINQSIVMITSTWN